jgi:RNA polymerase sigma-70 factor (ECF subfamily)
MNENLLKIWRRDCNRTLMRFLGKRVRPRVDVEDLAQETYLRVLRARDLSDVTNPEAYLLRVASHLVVEWRDRQLPADSIDATDEMDLAGDSSPELEIEATLSQARLERTLATMAPVMRAVLLLRLSHQRSGRQIAQELDLTPRQVKRYLVRGYALLHSTLET